MPTQGDRTPARSVTTRSRIRAARRQAPASMSGETSDELLQRVRGGELDARRILLTPDSHPARPTSRSRSCSRGALASVTWGGAAWARLDADRRRAHRRPRSRPPVLDRGPAQLLAIGAAGGVAGHLSTGRHVREDAGSLLPDRRAGASLCGSRCCGPQGDVREHPRLRLRLWARAAVLPRRVPRRAADRLRHHARRGRLLRAGVRRRPGLLQEDPPQIEPAGAVRHDLGRLALHARPGGTLDRSSSTCSRRCLAEGRAAGLHRPGAQRAPAAAARELAGTSPARTPSEIVRGFDETGYGYADWTGASGYGTSLNRPSWVCAQIEERPGLHLVGYREMGWGRQDVVTVRGDRQVSSIPRTASPACPSWSWRSPTWRAPRSSTRATWACPWSSAGRTATRSGCWRE